MKTLLSIFIIALSFTIRLDTANATSYYDCCDEANGFCVGWNESATWLDVSYSKVKPSVSRRFSEEQVITFDTAGEKINFVGRDEKSGKRILELHAIRQSKDEQTYKVQSGFILIDGKAVPLKNLLLSCEVG